MMDLNKPLYEQTWDGRYTAQVLIHIWWPAENEFDLLNDVQLLQAKQLFYRLSYLKDEELQFLKDKYYREANHPLGDQYLTDKYQMSKESLREWRLRLLDKLRPYRENPKTK